MRLCCKIGKENQKGSPSETALNERESIEKYVASPLSVAGIGWPRLIRPPLLKGGW
jgi:hypothetical protein